VDEAQEDECEQHQELADYFDAAREHLNVIAGTESGTPGFSFDDEFDALASLLRRASMKVEALEIQLPESVDAVAVTDGIKALMETVEALDIFRRGDDADAVLIFRVRDRVRPLFLQVLLDAQRLRADRGCLSFEDVARSSRLKDS
jgi:hypothetical protein